MRAGRAQPGATLDPILVAAAARVRPADRVRAQENEQAGGESGTRG
jgi:hypothetical protein